jgi:hypothetical protein
MENSWQLTPALRERFWGRVRVGQREECWPFLTCKGGIFGANHRYGQFWVSRTSYFQAHRLMFSMYNEMEVPAGMFVCHSCDYPLCVNPDHLWLGTPKDNLQDSHKKGRKKPPAFFMRKLSNEQVRLIRNSLTSAVQLARKFGVDPSAISLVRSRRTYRDVSD